jgi:2-polyprenyl-6-methoxyphenol hydroxylase-like FAD-dependent oxidoreductase
VRTDGVSPLTADGDGVLVAGAGPTGLLLAGDLAAAGVPVTVLERRTDQSPLSRALAVHSRSLEMLDARGIADEVISTGLKVSMLALLGRAQLDLSGLPTRFPFSVLTPQYKVERILERRARSLGAEIASGTAVTDVHQKPGYAEAAFRTESGVTGTRRAAYLVGADGAHSTVRRSLGMPFPGHSILRSVMLADVQLTDPPGQALQLSANHAGLAFLAHFGDGLYRVIAWNRDREVPDTEPVDMDEIRQITRLVLGSDFGMHDPRWMSRFHNDERQVPQYRSGRVFLAGDAAHVHSPAGGQGMNTGLLDAANLSWKLAAACHGCASNRLIDSYHAERHPVGRYVIRLSGSLVRLARIQPDLLRTAITEVVSAALQAPALSGKAGLAVSGLSISYPAGPDAHPLDGKRMPDVPLAGGGRLYELLRSGRFILLGGAGYALPAVDGWADRIRLAQRTRAQPRLILVRPDGYIAWASDEPADQVREHDLRTALTRWCGDAAAFSKPAYGRSAR